MNRGLVGLSNEGTDYWGDFLLTNLNRTSKQGLQSGNVLLGFQAGLNTQGTNAAFGNGSGTSNTLIGYQAGTLNTVNDGLVCIGYQAGYGSNYAISGGFNSAGGAVCIGYQAGFGGGMTASVYIGYQAGFGAVNGANGQNVMIGYGAGTGNNGNSGTNVCIGYLSGNGNGNWPGANNVFVGHQAGYQVGNVNGSTAVGSGAGQGAVGALTGSCTLIGFAAGNAVTSGQNTFIGYNSGNTGAAAANKTTTGSHQTCVGFATGQNTSTQLNYITCLGEGTQVGASGTVAIGVDNAGTSATTSTANEIALGTALQTVNHFGGVKYQVVSKTTTYAMNAYDFCVLANGTFTVTLPAPVLGATYVIKNTGSGTITLSQNASEKIDGANTISMATQYESVVVTSDGTNWFVIAANAGAII